MKTYMVLMCQGNGCDYTIGCGMACDTYEANSPEEAFQKWTDSRDMNLPEEECYKYYFPGGEGELQWVQVLELGETNEHLWPDYIEKKTQKAKKENLAAEKANELAEFERLKKKLGK